MNKRIPIFLGLLLTAFAIWLQLTSVSSIQNMRGRLENLAYDMQLRTKTFSHKKFSDSPAVIVDLDNKSLVKEGRWPWPRAKVAELLDHVRNAGAAVVAFDMLFPEPQNNIADTVLDELKKQSVVLPELSTLFKKIEPSFDDDGKFAASIKQLDVTLGMTFNPEPTTQNQLMPPILTLTTPEERQLGMINAAGYIANIPILQDAAKHSAFLNVFPDSDGIIRRVPLLIRYKDGLYPSLALQAVSLFLFNNVKLVTGTYNDSTRLEAIQLAQHIIPTDSKAQVIIPFFGTSYTLPFYSATDVLHDKLPPNALAGKVVFIGASATGVGDLHATAIQSVYPGVEVQASIADGILLNAFSYKPAWSLGAEIFLTFVLGLIFSFVFPYLGPRSLGILIILIPAALIMINNFIWSRTGLIITLLLPILSAVSLAVGNILYGYLFESRRREHLKEMFGQYVPEKHIDEMLKSSSGYGLTGDDREMTVLFADIRNFTTISEPLSASQLKDLLSEFFTPMTEIIFKHNGTIDKYVGDLIMAFWGAPLKDKRHAQHAIAAALDMQIAVRKLREEFHARNLPEISIGIGLNTGEMSVGDMGSKFRRNYTVLGDAVNLASRIEGLTKFYGVYIMVTENTQRDQKLFVFRQLDRVRVKGKKNGIAIFEVICRKNALTPEIEEELKLSQEALDYYFNQQWEQASLLFSALAKIHMQTKLYTLYLERINEFKNNPPPADWDGIYVHTSK